MSVYLEDIFSRIVEMSIIAGYCVLAVLVLRWLFRKAPKRYTYLLWLVVVFRLVCPLTVDSAFSIFNLKLLPESMKVESEVGGGSVELPETNVPNAKPEIGGNVGDQPGIAPGIDGNVVVQPDIKPEINGTVIENPGKLPELQGGVEQTPQTFPFREIDWMKIGAWVWVAGMVCLTATMVTSWIRLKQRVRTAVKVRTRVYETDAIDSAFVLGIRKPTIYLPVGLDRQEQAWVLLHETSHIRRKDYLVKMLATVLTIVYWFNPLVWVAWFGMCRDMEMSCDEMALEGADAELRKAYSRTLLTIATNKRLNWNVITAFGEVSVKSRIKHVLSFKKPAVWMGAMFAVIMVVVLAVFGTNGQANDGADVNAGIEESSQEDQADRTEGSAESSENVTEIESEGTSAKDEMDPNESMETESANKDFEGESWIDQAWADFDQKTEVEENLVHDGIFLPWGYTGFLDIHPRTNKYYPLNMDYDGDGLTDRVYQRSCGGWQHEVYLFFGSGEILNVDTLVWGFYDIESVDLDKDGELEIFFKHYVPGGDNSGSTYMSLFEKVNGQWKRVEHYHEGGGHKEKNSSDEWVSSFAKTVQIDLLLENVNDSEIRLFFAEQETEVTLWVAEELVSVFFDEEAGNYQEKIERTGRTTGIVLVYDEENDSYRIKCSGELGNRWTSILIEWDMSYVDNQWTVEAVYAKYGLGEWTKFE